MRECVAASGPRSQHSPPQDMLVGVWFAWGNISRGLAYSSARARCSRSQSCCAGAINRTYSTRPGAVSCLFDFFQHKQQSEKDTVVFHMSYGRPLDHFTHDLLMLQCEPAQRSLAEP
jgi:hypothetical protein